GRCQPEHAWVGGLLAPLGWLAVCAANPDHARDCLAAVDHDRHPAAVARRHWRFDQADLGRRLPRRRGLPAGLPAMAGSLGRPAGAENRRLRDGPTLHRVEAEADTLADALQEVRAEERERLRAQKLASLAEFAAGAGHEINNPLAVISGQAQFLLNKLRVPRP